ncbi:LysR family transcriptional regulator [Pleomorphomonas sp. PLEO]|uniref:LysR family transcriptional regulator n=1 Tax=Pleomorphomonas sp. PLEO TaxID=3239306 RepID=UPI00351F1D0A
MRADRRHEICFDDIAGLSGGYIANLRCKGPMLRPIEHGLDVRLMRIFLILIEECSVSRTAVRLGQSQPAVSLALKRLREILGDPLLVRSGAHLVPTERGAEIGRRMAAILAEIDGMVLNVETFEPSTDMRNLRIQAANCLGTFFLPRIAAALRREAPAMQVDFSAIPDERDIFEEMETGTIDLTIGNWPAPRENLRIAPLLDADMVLVMRRDHPMAERAELTLEEYLALEHLSPTPTASAAISPVDGRLAQLDRKRRISMTVPEFTLVPSVLAASTGLVFTSSRPFAEEMATNMPFALVDAPPELGLMKFYLLWHERAHHSPFNRWLRSLVRRVSQEPSDHESIQSSKKQAVSILPS